MIAVFIRVLGVNQFSRLFLALCKSIPTTRILNDTINVSWFSFLILKLRTKFPSLVNPLWE